MNGDLPRREKLFRWLRLSALFILVTYMMLLVYVQVSERVMRHRAEELLATMRELQVGKSPWADLQRIRTRWGAWGDYEGTCTEKHCDYTISFADVAGGPRVEGFVSYLGHGHLADAFLGVKVDQGIVKQARFQLWVEVPKGYGTRWEREQPQDSGYVPYSSGEYILIAKAISLPELNHLCCYWPEPVPHPSYVLMKPSGCEGCLSIWTEFVPEAEPAVKLLMTNFNFNCITRWRPCADEEDIMPGVGAEYEQETRDGMARYKHQDRCAYSVDELSKATLNAAVVRVESMSRGGSFSLENFKLRPIKRLGGEVNLFPNAAVNVDASNESLEGKLLTEAFTFKHPLIVLYPHAPEESRLQLYTCGVLPDSETAEKTVAAGMSLGSGVSEYD